MNQAAWAALAMARGGGYPWVAEGLSTGLGGSSEPVGLSCSNSP